MLLQPNHPAGAWRSDPGVGCASVATRTRVPLGLSALRCRKAAQIAVDSGGKLDRMRKYHWRVGTCQLGYWQHSLRLRHSFPLAFTSLCRLSAATPSAVMAPERRSTLRLGHCWGRVSCLRRLSLVRHTGSSVDRANVRRTSKRLIRASVSILDA